MTRYFTSKLYEFLRELSSNNERRWFETNKSRYLEDVRDPALLFISDFGERHLLEISAHLTADSRAQGGSLLRIYRDMRYSRGQPPYKPWVDVQFRHESAMGAPAPALHLHLGPRASWAGVGLWHPQASVARRVRESIADNPEQWHDAAHTFDGTWELATHPDLYLKRVPSELRSVGDDHPHPDDLRLRNFGASSKLTQKEVTSSRFSTLLAERYASARPLLAFLADHLGLGF